MEIFVFFSKEKKCLNINTLRSNSYSKIKVVSFSLLNLTTKILTQKCSGDVENVHPRTTSNKHRSDPSRNVADVNNVEIEREKGQDLKKAL